MDQEGNGRTALFVPAGAFPGMVTSKEDALPWLAVQERKKMAEREGFEPSVEVSPYTRLAGERLQPARPSLRKPALAGYHRLLGR